MCAKTPGFCPRLRAKLTCPLRTTATSPPSAHRILQRGALLGAGRLRKEDAIDPAVGIVMHKRVGEAVRRGEALFTIHANAHSDVTGAMNILGRAVTLSQEPVTPPELIHAVVE